MDRWVGKTAVVTGASAGIGAAICVALADAGVKVIGLARRPNKVDELKTQVRGKGTLTSRKCDVSSSEDLADTFKWIDEDLGGVHIMINNAGVFYGGCISAGDNLLSDEDVMATIDINLKGTIMCARHSIASMKKNGFNGHVVNINSIAGHYIPLTSTFNVYPCTKYAVTAFTAGLLNELTDYKNKIKVTSLSPGLVATELAGVSSHSDLAALEPKDIADAVLYVLSTPPHVNIDELTITPTTGKRL